MAFKSQDYSDFSESIHDKGYYREVPLRGHIELTFKCPFKCGFCYCSCYTSPEYTQHEMDTDTVIQILDQAAALGTLWISFSGGDPFIRKDFKKIYDHARSLGMIVTILCSGFLLTDEWLKHLKENPPFEIDIPFYGVTAATYEAVAGRKDSFETAFRNIQRFLNAGIAVRLKTKITNQNLQEADKIQKFIESLGLEFNPNYMIYPRLNGDQGPLELRLNPLEIRIFQEKYQSSQCDNDTMGFSTGTDQEQDLRLFKCAAGVHSYYINPYGLMNFCTYVRHASYDLKKGTIAEGMKFLKDELLTLTRSEQSACGSCNIASSCENCPGHAVLETGSMYGKSDYLCEVNHTLRSEL